MAAKNNATQINIYLSRIGEKIFVGFDGNHTELEDFGISMQKFNDIMNACAETFQKELGVQLG